MDKICYNGQFLEKASFSLSIDNRGFRYGDSFFETIKCYNGKPLFFEEHYFRIAASFCVLKLKTPSLFKIEFFKSLIEDLLIKNKLNNSSARVRISFFRSDGGYYLPNNHQVNFIIESNLLEKNEYKLNIKGDCVGLYKENLLPKTTLSNIKSNNKLLNVLASIYAKDNNYDDCILINDNKSVVEAISGNIFIWHKNILKTPGLENGCVNGVLRTVLLNNHELKIKECLISISDLFNAEEVFITNVICGVKWVKTINNITYANNRSKQIIKMLNDTYLI